ncbi:MAG: hypothetical protein K2O12_00260, partial [Muribaculaceae bacterium]|nr:hypothetical protein [Muribaculaceae bacterium]
LALVVASCGSSSSGLAQKEAEALCSKIDNNEEFSQDDYAKAIALSKAATAIIFDGMANIDTNDNEKAQEQIRKFTDSDEYKMIEKASGKIMSYLVMHTDDLDEANKKAMDDVEQYAKDRAMELQKKMFGV